MVPARASRSIAAIAPKPVSIANIVETPVTAAQTRWRSAREREGIVNVRARRVAADSINLGSRPYPRTRSAPNPERLRKSRKRFSPLSASHFASHGT